MAFCHFYTKLKIFLQEKQQKTGKKLIENQRNNAQAFIIQIPALSLHTR